MKILSLLLRFHTLNILTLEKSILLLVVISQVQNLIDQENCSLSKLGNKLNDASFKNTL